MNDKFDRVMSKVGLFLGGVVVTIVGVTIMGTMMNNKDKQTLEIRNVITDEQINNALEQVRDSNEEEA